MAGQLAPNAGNVWVGNGYAVAAYDTTRPVRFQGGPLSIDLYWNPAMDSGGGGFASLPFFLAGCVNPVQLLFYPRLGYDDVTWGLAEVDGESIGDWMIEFDGASTGPAVNISGRTNWLRMWAIHRAGATNFTLTQ